MSAKTDFQTKYVKSYNKHFGGNVTPVFELAGDVWDAKNGEVEAVDAAKTLTAADGGKTFLCSGENLVISLPATAAGLRYRFINVTARTTAKLSISPVAADGISGSTSATTNVVLAGVVNKDAINTKATQEVGDSLEIMGTGLTGTKAWIILNATGIWAAEG